PSRVKKPAACRLFFVCSRGNFTQALRKTNYAMRINPIYIYHSLRLAKWQCATSDPKISRLLQRAHTISGALS
ncbi:MAG: hypothetical protein RSC66_08415, partial [Comamonas sp.]